MSIWIGMWNQDLNLITTNELEGLCDELEMKLDEGRGELRRRILARCRRSDKEHDG